MNTIKLFFLAQTVLLPIVLCIVRFKHIKQLYLPLFIYLLVKEVVEVVSIILIKFYDKTSNAIPYNLMFLADALLITWQFYNLGALEKKSKVFIGFQIFWIFLWIADMFFIGKIDEFNIVFRVSSCFILVFIATPLISKTAVRDQHNMYRNTAFIVCLIFALWFTYNILYEFAYKISNINESLVKLGARITKFIGFAEAIVFLVCTWAIYCIPKKRDFLTT